MATDRTLNMLVDAGRIQTLMTFLAIADIESQARRPLAESKHFSAFLTLLIGIQPDLEATAAQIAASTTLANALHAGMENIDKRELARNFPRESPDITLASQRLRLSYPHHPATSALKTCTEHLTAAKAQSLLSISSGFASDAAPLAARWRTCAASMATLLRAIEAAFDERAIRGSAEDITPIIRLLDATATSDTSLIASDGALKMPALREGREARRVRVRCPATITQDGKNHDAVVRDMSIGGLGLEHADDVKQGKAISVMFGTGLTLEGRVEWAQNGRAGVKLDSSLEANDPRLNFLARSNPAKRTH